MTTKRNISLTVAGLLFLFTISKISAQNTGFSMSDSLSKTIQTMSDDLNKLKQLKITGYLQPQWQLIDSAGAPSFAGGDFVNANAKYDNRITMRRGRFKFTYDHKNFRYMLNSDVTEKGYGLRETYVKVTDPWLKMFSLTTGLLQVQFGFEVAYSSSERETPERARYNQTLFPTERDLGVFGSIEFPKTSALKGLKADIAVMNGAAAISPEFDNYKDFSGRLQYGRRTENENFSYAIGASYYNGGYRIGTVKDYKEITFLNGDKGFGFSADTANYNRKAKRNYIASDIQLSMDSKIGVTTLRAEYIQGIQPGTDKTSRSASALPTSAIYLRNFNGAYFYFIQDIAKTKFQVVAKYDWYDPNATVAGKEIGKTGTNTQLADIRFDTYGFGITYKFNNHVKLVTYYDIVKNESTLIKGYTRDIRDNVITVRMQYKF